MQKLRPALRPGHRIALLQGGVGYFAALVRAIDAAQHSVGLETYIFDFNAEHGVASLAVARALARAAERGVQVRLLMDGVGTGDVPAAWAAEFDKAGVQWRIYSPFGWAGYVLPSRWRRLHRKLCVVDADFPSAIGFCGGINLLDDYFDPNHGVLNEPRFDFALHIQGPLVADMAAAQAALWQKVSGMNALQRVTKRLINRLSARPRSTAAQVPSDQSAGVPAALLLRDNLVNRRRIEVAYRRAVAGATTEIWIANAYFVPGGRLRRGLIAAAKRGVQVTLLLQGKREYFFQVHATRAVYASLLQAGIRIVEYKASFLHAKVAVVDADNPRTAWATVGSSNLDPFSMLMAREANVVVQDAAFAQDLRQRLHHAALSEGVPVKADTFLNRPWHQRSIDHFAYAVMRSTLWLLGKRY